MKMPRSVGGTGREKLASLGIDSAWNVEYDFYAMDNFQQRMHAA